MTPHKIRLVMVEGGVNDLEYVRSPLPSEYNSPLAETVVGDIKTSKLPLRMGLVEPCKRAVDDTSDVSD